MAKQANRCSNDALKKEMTAGGLETTNPNGRGAGNALMLDVRSSLRLMGLSLLHLSNSNKHTQ